MKKLLSIIVLGLLYSSIAHAQVGKAYNGSEDFIYFKMKCHYDLKYPDAGIDFLLDRYTGRFIIEAYAVDRKYGWMNQDTGTCDGVEKKF